MIAVTGEQMLKICIFQTKTSVKYTHCQKTHMTFALVRYYLKSKLKKIKKKLVTHKVLFMFYHLIVIKILIIKKFK